ncbi:MAG: nitrite reductase, copper-containing [Chloroflexi bacterium]|nr:nitrite reductase, copper-containing [Chloroflexota bacterium]
MVNETRSTTVGHWKRGSLASVLALVVGLFAFASVACTSDSSSATAQDVASAPTALPATPTPVPEPTTVQVANQLETAAKPITIEEISRHPIDMPPSTDYTLYKDGQYQNFVERTGPITQEIHFQIEEGVARVVDGTTMDYWTFNGGIPGPMIRARVGDTLDFYLYNPADSFMPHNVDFHAVTGPGGGAVKLDTLPGAMTNLQVKLLNPGIYVYHCAFPDIPTHISKGMYGLIVVEPEEGLPEVDHEFYLMQSEFYSEAGGGQSAAALADSGHLAFAAEYGYLEQPSFVTFNGRPGAVVGDRALGTFGDDPILVGDTIRLFVGNIGPNLSSSFHVIGEIFDRVYVEGSFSLVNENVQTTMIPAGGAVGVEFTVEVPGDYILVDHAIFRINKGAAGILHVEGEPQPDIFNPIQWTEIR